MTEISSAHLKDLVLRTIEVYNRYRSPETTATLFTMEKDGFVLDFEGSFCTTCGHPLGGPFGHSAPKTFGGTGVLAFQPSLFAVLKRTS